jgi:LCP family protein required for cell wall assembly
MVGAKKKKWLLIIFTGIALLSLSVVAYAMYQYNQLFNRIYHPLEEEPEQLPIGTGSAANPNLHSTPNQEEQKEVLKPFTLLVMGIDSRGEEHSRSDTMLYTVVNPNSQKVAIVPIVRDIRVEIPGHGMQKMNHSMFLGGVPLVKKTVENFVGIPVQRYITVDFEGFKRVIDEIGGIRINVKKRMKYTDPTDETYIDLKKGWQTLNGQNALYYARYRKSDIGRDDTDEERSDRQIEVIKAVFEQGKDKLSVFNIFSLMNIAGDHIKTDLSKKEIEMLIKNFHHFSADQVISTHIAGEGKRYPYGKYRLYFLDVNDAERQRIKEFLKNALNEGMNRKDLNE